MEIFCLVTGISLSFEALEGVVELLLYDWGCQHRVPDFLPIRAPSHQANPERLPNKPVPVAAAWRGGAHPHTAEQSF